MMNEEPQISDSLMGLAMEFRFHVIDEVRKIHPQVVIPQLRAGGGHHRTFSIVPGGEKTITVHHPSTRQRTYEFFVISTMDLFEAENEETQIQAAENFGGIAPKNRHVKTDRENRFTGDTDADPFRGRFSLGALYEVATAIRRGGSISPEVSMEFAANWDDNRLKEITIHLIHPKQQQQKDKPEIPEIHGKPLDQISSTDANHIADQCVDKIRGVAEERYRLSPAALDAYISLDKTGTRVFGIGIRRWLD